MSKINFIGCVSLTGICLLLILILTPGHAQEQTPTPFPTSVYEGYPDTQEAFGLKTFFLRCVSWSPDSQMLAVGTARGLRLYDKDYHLIADMGGQYGVMSVSWSPDGKYVATSSLDYTVWIWDIENLTPVRVFTDHHTIVEQVVWNPDGIHLASGDIEGWVFVWEANTGRIIRKIPPMADRTSMIFGLAWHKDADLLAFIQGINYFVWDYRKDVIIWEARVEKDRT